MDGDRPTPAAAAASVASVLDDDDLLREILLRLGFPTCLVRAALVSKRWLHHASAPAFLRRFRERHPPRLLGFCAIHLARYQFVPLPQPPELAAPSRRAASSCNDAFARGVPRIKHCRNGRLIFDFFHGGKHGVPKLALLAPLLGGEFAAVLPPTPPRNPGFQDQTQKGFTGMFLPEDGGCDGITLVNLWKVGRKVYAEVYVLGSGAWGVPANAVTEIELPGTTFLTEMLPPVHGKVFMETSFGCILGLDLAAVSFFTLELPAGVQSNYMLSCAKESGLYLVSADGFQLSVWLHGMTGDGDGAGGWLLVDTFCVHETCTRLAGDSWVPHSNHIYVAVVGDNADFVLLDHAASGVVFYVHLKSRVVEKVHQRVPIKWRYPPPLNISPIVMTWPPVFPARNVGHAQEE